MVNRLDYLLALIVSASIAGSCSADTFLSAGLTYETQDYREFSRSGLLLDRDSGALRGPRIEAAWETAKNKISLTHQNIHGRLAYSSISTISQVEAREQKSEIYGQHRLSHRDHYSLFMTAGAGIKTRQRNIAGTATLSGLNETYNHKYGIIGLYLQYRISDAYNLHGTVNYLKDFDTDIEVAFATQLFDPIRFPISTSSEHTLQVELQRKLEKHWVIAINRSQVFVQSARSRSFTLNKNGSPTNNSVSEPQSKTRINSTTISLGRTF